MESFLKEVKNWPILHSQYRVWWCPDDAKSQDISNPDIYYVEPNKFGPRKIRVKACNCILFWKFHVHFIPIPLMYIKTYIMFPNGGILI